MTEKHCARCGKKINNLHWGYISPNYYCHTDDPYPTCYMRASWEQAGKLNPKWLETDSD
jgi:hypothetical protein